MSYYGTKRLQENSLYVLAKLDRQVDVVGMKTLSKESIRVKNKSKGKRKKNKKVDSRKSVEESSYEHIGLSSNNSNESFLSESSDTLNDDLIGLSKQCLTYPKKPDHRPPQWKFREKLQQTVLSKTDILLLKLTIHFLILNSSQKASKCTIKIESKPEEDFYSM